MTERPEKATLCELDQAELAQVGGGYDDNNFCGTVPFRIHWPVPPLPWVTLQPSALVMQGAMLQQIATLQRGGLMA